MLSISEESGENLYSVVTGKKSEGLLVLRREKMMICFDASFANKDAAASNQLCPFPVDPNVKVLPRSASA